jgi:hypothetical protein
MPGAKTPLEVQAGRYGEVWHVRIVTGEFEICLSPDQAELVGATLKGCAQACRMGAELAQMPELSSRVSAVADRIDVATKFNM